MDGPGDEGGDPVGMLVRWDRAGAVWRVLANHDNRFTVGLYTCDGGEEVGRFSSSDPMLVTYLAGRSSNVDAP